MELTDYIPKLVLKVYLPLLELVDPGLYGKADSMYVIFWTFCTGN